MGHISGASGWMSVTTSGLGGTGCGLGRKDTRVFGVVVMQSKGIMLRCAETSIIAVASILI